MTEATPIEGTFLRVAVPDRIGSLALIAQRLADAGVDILRVEVLGRDGTSAVDDLLVRGRRAEEVLRGLHPEVRLLAVREHADLPDPGLAMARACAAVTRAASLAAARSALVGSALELVAADRGLLLRDTGGGRLRAVAPSGTSAPAVRLGEFPAAAEALDSGLPVVSTGDREWAPAELRDQLAGGMAVTVAVGAEPHLVLSVVRTEWFPFVQPEVDRLLALVAVADGVLRLRGERPRSAPGERGVPTFTPAVRR